MTIDLDGSIALDDDDDESAETDDATNARAFLFFVVRADRRWIRDRCHREGTDEAAGPRGAMPRAEADARTRTGTRLADPRAGDSRRNRRRLILRICCDR